MLSILFGRSFAILTWSLTVVLLGCSCPLSIAQLAPAVQPTQAPAAAPTIQPPPVLPTAITAVATRASLSNILGEGIRPILNGGIKG